MVDEQLAEGFDPSEQTIDRMVRELITARGNPYDNGPANFFVAFQGADAAAEATAQVFMGMRVQCAKCHHHPFERISQADFRGLASFFGQVANKPSAGYGKLGGPSVILVRSDETLHEYPKTILGMPIPVRLKGGKLDRRELLADWLTAPENKTLARNIVNRLRPATSSGPASWSPLTTCGRPIRRVTPNSSQRSPRISSRASMTSAVSCRRS